jgi:hypothetical protein
MVVAAKIWRDNAEPLDFLHTPKMGSDWPVMAIMCSSRWAAVEIGELLKPGAFIVTNPPIAGRDRQRVARTVKLSKQCRGRS